MSRSLPSWSYTRGSLPIVDCIPSSSRSFSTTPTPHRALAVRIASKRKATRHQALKAEIHKEDTGAIDPILGHVNRELDETPKGRAPVPKGSTPWDNCRLARTLIHPNTIQNLPPPRYTTGEKPKFYLPGLSTKDRKLLFGAVPHVSSALQYNPDATAVVREEMMGEVLHEQGKQNEMMMRILDLRNASRAGIALFNRERVVREFGKLPQDTGSSAVQAAILTTKIRGLNEHILQNRKDVSNQRALRMMVQKRAKILKYLKRKEPGEYDQVLADLGLEKLAVEGELIIRMK